jgi:Outer membrane protein beta-barrel domain
MSRNPSLPAHSSDSSSSTSQKGCGAAATRRHVSRTPRGWRIAAATLCLLLLAAMPARADFFITPFAAIKFAGDATIVDLDSGASNVKFTLGGMAGVLSDGLFGVEADVAYVPRFFERSTSALVTRSHVLTIMGNVMVAVPRSVTGYSLRPFVSGGAGLMHVNIDDVLEIVPVDSNLFGINAGGGAVGQLTPNLDVRFELRWFKSVTSGSEQPLRPGPPLTFWRIAVGLTIR